MVTLLKSVAVLSIPLVFPIVCGASTADSTAAVDNCAQALSLRLHARVSTVKDELATPVPGAGWAPGVRQESGAQQMVVEARDTGGRLLAQMLCTYDAAGRVVNLQPATDVALALDLDQ